jgi:hypothetical protein
MKISVISVSIRPKGLEITQKCLAKQIFQDFEWITELSVPEKGHDLNKAYNINKTIVHFQLNLNQVFDFHFSSIQLLLSIVKSIL